MLEATQKVAVTLEAQQWGLVLRELGRARFSRVAEVIGRIQTQCVEQDKETGASVSRLHPVPPADASA